MEVLLTFRNSSFLLPSRSSTSIFQAMAHQLADSVAAQMTFVPSGNARYNRPIGQVDIKINELPVITAASSSVPSYFLDSGRVGTSNSGSMHRIMIARTY